LSEFFCIVKANILEGAFRHHVSGWCISESQFCQVSFGYGTSIAIPSFDAFLSLFLKTGLELMADMVLHPTFPKIEWKLLKKQTQEGIKTWYSDAGTVAKAHLTKLAFGDTPAGNMMTKSTLKNISLDDAKEFTQTQRLCV
jgi:predicted Zn-dependent peptidase